MADGYSNWFNGYDNQIYTVGRGPSTMTVTAPNLAAASGQPVVIAGSVLDVSCRLKARPSKQHASPTVFHSQMT